VQNRRQKPRDGFWLTHLRRIRVNRFNLDAHREWMTIAVIDDAAGRCNLHRALLLPAGLISEKLVLEDLQLEDAAGNHQHPAGESDGQNEKMSGMKRGFAIGHRLSLTSSDSKLGPELRSYGV